MSPDLDNLADVRRAKQGTGKRWLSTKKAAARLEMSVRELEALALQSTKLSVVVPRYKRSEGRRKLWKWDVEKLEQWVDQVLAASTKEEACKHNFAPAPTDRAPGNSAGRTKAPRHQKPSPLRPKKSVNSGLRSAGKLSTPPEDGADLVLYTKKLTSRS